MANIGPQQFFEIQILLGQWLQSHGPQSCLCLPSLQRKWNHLEQDRECEIRWEEAQSLQILAQVRNCSRPIYQNRSLNHSDWKSPKKCLIFDFFFLFYFIALCTRQFSNIFGVHFWRENYNCLIGKWDFFMYFQTLWWLESKQLPYRCTSTS